MNMNMNMDMNMNMNLNMNMNMATPHVVELNMLMSTKQRVTRRTILGKHLIMMVVMITLVIWFEQLRQ